VTYFSAISPLFDLVAVHLRSPDTMYPHRAFRYNLLTNAANFLRARDFLCRTASGLIPNRRAIAVSFCPSAKIRVRILAVGRIQLKQPLLHLGLPRGRRGQIAAVRCGNIVEERFAEPGAGTSAQVGVGDVSRHRTDKRVQFSRLPEIALPQGPENSDHRIMQEVAGSFAIVVGRRG